MALPFAYPSGNVTSITNLLPYLNSVTTGYFGVGILLCVFLITFVTGKSFSAEKALSFSGFLTMIVAVLLRMMSLITDGVLTFVVIMFCAITLWMWMQRQQES